VLSRGAGAADYRDMRLWHASTLPVAISASLLCVCAPALALPDTPGGAPAPAAPAAPAPAWPAPQSQAGPSPRPRAGPPAHPLLGELRVAQSASAGRPPSVTLRVQDTGVASVDLQVSLLSGSPAHAALVARLGWAPAGHTLRVTWPARFTLAAGTYVLNVSGHDSRGEALLAGAHAPLSVKLVLRAGVRRRAARPAHRAHPAPSAAPHAPAPAPAPVPGGVPAAGAAPPSGTAPAAGVPSPAQSAAEGAVFPVAGPHNFGGPENAFGAPRGSYTHQGQDVLTAEGTAVVAPLDGTIESTSYQEGGAGYYAVEHTAVGLSFFFAHCEAGSLAVAAGQQVAAGALLCRAGQTGDATAPHLHFEIWLDGWRTAAGYPIDPLPYLQAWEAHGAA